MTRRVLEELALGPELVRRLIAHRPPLLLVSRIESYSRLPRSALRASFDLPEDHPIFSGHFPEAAIWPGSYTMEGLAQACACLRALGALERDAASLELGIAEHLSQLPEGATPGVGLLAATCIKFTHPVMPGQTLCYEVELVRELEALASFRGEASVGGRLVAEATLTLARAERRLGTRR